MVCSLIFPGSKRKLPNAAEHIKKKLPSMYHQFKKLADIDITKEPMEVGPTTHYMMGGIRVDADTQMSTFPDFLLQANVQQDCMVPTGLVVIHFLICWFLENVPVNLRQDLPKKMLRVLSIQNNASRKREALEPFERREGDNHSRCSMTCRR